MIGHILGQKNSLYYMNDTYTPKRIKLHKNKKTIEVSFPDGKIFLLTANYLRVFSPSAEVKGHNGGEGVLILGKEDVEIKDIEPIGLYAIKLIFNDGHNTGIYTWQIIYELGINFEKNWKRYLERIKKIGR